MKKLSFAPRILAGTFALGSLLLAAPGAFSDTGKLSGLRSSIVNIREKSSAERQQARSARARATALNHKAEAVHERLEKTQQLLGEANSIFQEYSFQKKQTEARIVAARHRVQIVTARYEKHKELFGQRLASVQRNGQHSSLNMLLGSRTLSDLSRRMYLYQAIAARDSDLQEAIKEDKLEMERAQNELMAQWQERNQLVQALDRERARIVVAEREQQKYLKEIKSSVQAQLAYAQVKESTALALEGDIRRLETERARIIAAYEAQQRAKRAAAALRSKRRVHTVAYQGGQNSGSNSGGAVGSGATALNRGGWHRPAAGRLSSRYGMRFHPILRRHKLHSGLDIAASHGSPIKAAKAGRVLFSGWKAGYGNTVIIDHGGGITTLYGHASRLNARAGQPVQAGQLIARVGSTGYSTGPHLHFEVRKNGRPINPAPYLNRSQ